MKNNNKLVSVVIPTHNRLEDLNRLLQSIKLSSYQNLEIIVVNNFNKQLPKDIYQQVDTVIENKANLGLAAARNLGAHISKGEYILFVDDDNILDFMCIENLKYSLEIHKDFIGVGPVTYYNNNRDKIWFLSVKYNFYTSRFDFNYSIDNVSLISNRYCKTDNLHNCFMVRKVSGEQNNWFDKKIFLGGTEFEFFMRLKSENKNILVTDIQALSYHNIPFENEKDELRKLGITSNLRIYYFQRNRGIFIKKYSFWYQRILFAFFLYPAFGLFYFYKFIKHGRYDLIKFNFLGLLHGYIYLLFGKLLDIQI